MTTDASVNIFDVEANMDSSVSPTGDPAVRKAIRLALDYAGYARLSGAGAAQAPGVIPSQFLGALSQDDAVKQDLDAAKAALGGRTGIKLKIGYPSDATPNGVSFASVAQKVKCDLDKIGIDVTLDGSPAVTFLKNYAAGKNQLSVSYWGPDYPDPNDYLVYAPGAPGTSRAADDKWTKDARAGDRGAGRQGRQHPGRHRARLAVPGLPAQAQRGQPVLPAVPARAGDRRLQEPVERRARPDVHPQHPGRWQQLRQRPLCRHRRGRDASRARTGRWCGSWRAVSARSCCC